MKKLLFILLLASTWACSSPKAPIFLGLENIKAKNISTKNIHFTGEAIFHNPNIIGGTLTNIDINVLTNGVAIASIQQETATSVPSNADFKAPFAFSTSPKTLFKENGNSMLGGVINALFKKSVDLNFKGKVRFKIGGIPFTTDVDFTETVEL